MGFDFVKFPPITHAKINFLCIFGVMNRRFVSVLVGLLCCQSFVQAQTSAVLDVRAQRLIYRYHRLQSLCGSQNSLSAWDCQGFLVKNLQAEFGVEAEGSEIITGAFLTVDEKVIDQSAFQALHAQVQTRAGDVWTVRLPLRNLEALAAVKGILRIEADFMAKPDLDLSVKDIRADSVHQGLTLPRPFKGKDVLVGIVDGGFDFTHPVFRKNEGNDIRIIRFWNQEVAGKRPQGFTYGSELQGSEAILAAQHDQSGASHATHVAGIAAGVGAPNMRQFTGVAPEAEIIGVRTNFRGTGILNGVQYCFNQARDLNKPIAVNLSIGGRSGPRDGTSSFDRAVDNIVTAGRIVCGAAGNSGQEPYHLSKTFTKADTVRTVANTFEDGNYRVAYVDIWSEVNKSVSARLVLYDSTGTFVRAVTNFMPSAQNRQYYEDSFRVASMDNAWINYALASSNNSVNINRRSQLLLYAKVPKHLKPNFVLEVAGENSGFHAWNIAGDFTDAFPSGNAPQGLIKGDTMYTISEVGGTAKKIITAGAYTIRLTFVNIEGKTDTVWKRAYPGAIAPFSGVGPMLDGRMKPDISAPGNMICSGASSFDKEGYPLIKEYQEGDKKWRFVMMHGTSMAAPHLTGTVALLLEINPKLTYDDIHRFLIASARQDTFTGIIPAEGTPNWGWGKLNAMGAIKALLASPLSVADESVSATQAQLFLYPNPANDRTTVHAVRFPLGQATLRLSDLAGRTLVTENFTLTDRYQEIALPTDHLSAGCYLLEMQSGGIVRTVKVMVE
jgi:subtilisin family serine protease